MKRASTRGWSVTAPDTILAQFMVFECTIWPGLHYLPPVLKNPMREIRRADSSLDRPRCWVMPGRYL